MRSFGLFIAWLIALIGLLVSLYYSEILHTKPCFLCWYQRICMFPLALILGIGAYRQDQNILYYGIPLAAIGALFALFQIFEKNIPVLQSGVICKNGGVDCKDHLYEIIPGFTFPMLSLIGFILIIFFLSIYSPKYK